MKPLIFTLILLPFLAQATCLEKETLREALTCMEEMQKSQESIVFQLDKKLSEANAKIQSLEKG